MVITQSRPKRSAKGARYIDYRKKKLYEIGREPTHTKIGEKKSKTFSTRGSSVKRRIFFAQEANVLNPKTKKYEKSKIKAVIENPSNRHFVRRNIITKGSVIETESGKAKVTSRPGQHGTINAVLIS